MTTKPVISFDRTTDVPLDLDENHPIVQQSNGSNYANKTALTTYVDTLWVAPTSDAYLYAKCGCGVEYDYVDSAAVPATDVTCVCGRKVIEYS